MAARAVGLRVVQALWLVLRGSLAYFAATAENRTPQGLRDMVASMASGEPGWLAAVTRDAADVLPLLPNICSKTEHADD